MMTLPSLVKEQVLISISSFDMKQQVTVPKCGITIIWKSSEVRNEENMNDGDLPKRKTRSPNLDVLHEIVK